MPYKDIEKRNEYARKYAREHREQCRASDKKSYYKHVEKRKAKSRKWNKENKKQRATNQRRFYKKHAELQIAWQRGNKRKKRLKVIAHYGGKCQCCGEDRYEFLAIDHINGGGNEHRKKDGIGCLATWIVKNNFPKGFRILCHNCNASYGFYGYCPHHLDEKTREEFWGKRLVTREKKKYIPEE